MISERTDALEVRFIRYLPPSAEVPLRVNASDASDATN